MRSELKINRLDSIKKIMKRTTIYVLWCHLCKLTAYLLKRCRKGCKANFLVMPQVTTRLTDMNPCSVMPTLTKCQENFLSLSMTAKTGHYCRQPLLLLVLPLVVDQVDDAHLHPTWSLQYWSMKETKLTMMSLFCQQFYLMPLMMKIKGPRQDLIKIQA